MYCLPLLPIPIVPVHPLQAPCPPSWSPRPSHHNILTAHTGSTRLAHSHYLSANSCHPDQRQEGASPLSPGWFCHDTQPPRPWLMDSWVGWGVEWKKGDGTAAGATWLPVQPDVQKRERSTRTTGCCLPALKPPTHTSIKTSSAI